MRSNHWDKLASTNYFKEIISPFSEGVENPLYKMLKSIRSHNKKSVIEIGCGMGFFIPFLANNFKKVVAIDLSKRMIAAAKKSNNQSNVKFKVMDVVNLLRLKEKFDVAVCVNSLIMPNIPKVNDSLLKINKSLKKGGRLIGVFPSFDSIVYHALIVFDKEYERKKSRSRARYSAGRVVSSTRHDFCYGMLFKRRAAEKQKHYYGFELEYRLKKAGFKDIKLSKIYYPWAITDEPKPKRFKNPVYNQLWDWVVHARKG